MGKNEIKRPIKKGVAKTPVVMQLEALECGAACLTMIMAYYGKWVPLEQVRSDCGVSRDGTKAKNIVVAARSYGFKAGGYRFEPEGLKAEGLFPCIIHWEFNHFVVLCGFRGDKAVINDPARGTVEVSAERFDEAFTGVVLMIEPDEGFRPSGEPKHLWTAVKKRLRGAGPSVAFVVIVSFIASILGVINPTFSRVLLDRLLTRKNPSWFVPFMVLLCAVYALTVIVSAAQTLYFNRLGGKLAVTGSASFLWKALHLPMDFFSQRMAGDLLNRQRSNMQIANTLIMTFAPLVLNGVMIVFYLAVMLRYSFVLTAVGVSSIVINTVLGRLISNRRTNVMRVQMRDEGKLQSSTVVGVEMIETIKASGSESGYFRRWAGYQASANNQRVRFAAIDAYFGMIPAAVSALSNTAVLVLGVWFAMRGRFTPGMIMTFQGFIASISQPVDSMLSADRTLQQMRVSMERVDDVMEYPEDPCFAAKGEDDGYQKLKGRVEVKNVTFGYARLGEPLIRDLSFTLEPGRSVALVGPSGCGKSTISKLVSGLYAPWSGEILFDGKPASRIDRDVFTSSVAVVDQDIILFEDTIANNIRMWDASIEDFEMILAARDAGLHEDIMQREGGYNAAIAEGGTDLSGGQRQRMEIARVLAQDPTIIILDEATSALDARTEYQVVESVKRRGVALIVVAHRLSTIRDCDEIIVLDRGEVVERGTHDQLMALGGRYAELVTGE